MQVVKETQQSLNRVSLRFYESRLRGVLGVSEINICEEGEVFMHKTVQAPWLLDRRSQLSIDALARQWGFGGWRSSKISLEIQRVWANQSLECVTVQQLLTE